MRLEPPCSGGRKNPRQDSPSTQRIGRFFACGRRDRGGPWIALESGERMDSRVHRERILTAESETNTNS